MPDAPRSAPLTFRGIDDIVEAVRRDGGRLSASRRQVLEALFAADGPVSAEYLAGGMGGSGAQLELSSVYRSLEHLERLGAVRHVHLGHGPGLYALTGAGEREYLACERCGRVTAVEPRRLEPVRALVSELTGYEARFTHFPITGLCATCAASTSGELPIPDHHSTGASMSDHHDHRHEAPHTHEHAHDDVTHEHPHSEHDHDHVEHVHEHSHGDHVHSHAHLHQEGLEEQHEHGHD